MLRFLILGLLSLIIVACAGTPNPPVPGPPEAPDGVKAPAKAPVKK